MNDARPFRSLSTGEQILALIASLAALIPFAIAAFGFLLTTVPFFPPIALTPNLGLILVYLFALYRPDQVPVWAGMPLGVIADFLLGMPVGANALAIPLWMFLIQYVDSFTKRVHWLADWLLFLPFLFIMQLLLWLLCTFAGPNVPFLPFLTQGASTFAFFPLVAFLFVTVQRSFVDRLRR